MNKLRVLFATTEIAPYAKVGGLGDVCGALPRALAGLGVDVTLVMPRYASIDLQSHGFVPVPTPANWTVGINYDDYPFDFWRSKLPGSDVDVILIGNATFYNRPGIYHFPDGRPYPDEGKRDIFFQRAVMEMCKLFGYRPDLIHCHDHHTALIPAYLKTLYSHDSVFQGTASVMTIHNMEYQGRYNPDILSQAGFDPTLFQRDSPFEFFGMVNFMRIAIAFADALSTVSERYALEIQSSSNFGHGLEGMLRARTADLFGIVNGIDTSVWNPAVDPFLPAPFDKDHLEGKLASRQELLQRCRLPLDRPDVPIISFIGRLVSQKGLELLAPLIDWLLGQDVYLIMLGSGEARYEDLLRRIGQIYPEKVGIRLGFDEAMAHLIEAGSDIFVMPSRHEPCGLNQLYSMAYGTIPVVHATGGLVDTVRDWTGHPGEGTGFVFDEYHPSALGWALERALRLFGDREQWNQLMRNAMDQDWSWERSAKLYMTLYGRALSKRRL